jgi:hypothetical protein
MMYIVRSIEKQSSHKPRLTKVDNQKTIDSSSYNLVVVFGGLGYLPGGSEGLLKWLSR